jgi:hypothetical protein
LMSRARQWQNSGAGASSEKGMDMPGMHMSGPRGVH